MAGTPQGSLRIAFQGEYGAFSEAAAIQLLGEEIVTVPRPTFDSAFRATDEGAADALLAPVENTLAGSVVRVYDLLLESSLDIVAETILRIEHHVIGVPGSTLEGLRSVASHPMALAQCEQFFLKHPTIKRIPAEDTAGSVRDAIAHGEPSAAGIAGRRAAVRYGGVILAEAIQDNNENFTRFVLLVPRDSINSNALLSPRMESKVHKPSRAAARPSAGSAAGRAAALCQPRHQSSENRKPADSWPPLGIPVLSRRADRRAAAASSSPA